MRNIGRFAVVGLASLVLAGCGGEASNELVYEAKPFSEVVENKSKFKGVPITLEGMPSSASLIVNRYNTKLAFVISDSTNSLLCYSKADNSLSEIYVKANALMDSEIGDDDEESIRVSGVMDGEGVFIANQIEVNGYILNLKSDL